MGGMAIPLLIHLWNSRQRRTMQVGSIALLEKNEQNSHSRIRITEWLLLLLRCLLIALLAVLLAKPLWRYNAAARQKGWVVVDESQLAATYHHFHTTIDSLLNSGYILHYLNNAAAAASFADTTQPAAVTNRALYWQQFTQLDKQAPAGLPFVVFTSNAMQHFTGVKPVTGRVVQWITFSPTDTARWIECAYAAAGDSLRIISGASNTAATVFETAVISAKTGAPGFVFSNQHGLLNVAAFGDTAVADTATLHIEYAGNNPDVAYVTAAVKAIAQYTGRRIMIAPYTGKQDEAHPADWLFWLSDKKLPASNARHVLLYDGDKATQQYSVLPPLIPGMQQPVALLRSNTAATDTAHVLWRDAFGQALLAGTASNGQTIVHFYSRFNTEWNNLTWNSAFPVMLLQLLLPQNAHYKYDNRTLDSLQVQPVFLPAAGNSAGSNANAATINLTPVCWIILLLVFITERLVALRQKRRANAAV
ncbi:hypothetical protein DXN05_04295 [Deminuibacter soli]|uniref:Aerotolerance regulator N-terminal domain-containing protein n=2 Tax=Deminuibacter soli TaxID=2291815 RepID=A0A3E1NQY7_9BACT|nr:hypothetical protein DXN05_04295 [Deminuibacter soli]